MQDQSLNKSIRLINNINHPCFVDLVLRPREFSLHTKRDLLFFPLETFDVEICHRNQCNGSDKNETHFLKSDDYWKKSIRLLIYTIIFHPWLFSWKKKYQKNTIDNLQKKIPIHNDDFLMFFSWMMVVSTGAQPGTNGVRLT